MGSASGFQPEERRAEGGSAAPSQAEEFLGWGGGVGEIYGGGVQGRGRQGDALLDTTSRPDFDGKMKPALLAHLRDAASREVLARHEGKPVRVQAKPRLSAAGRQDEAWRKAWEDVVKGRAWSASSDHPALEGARETSRGRVPSMLLDRAVALDGLLIYKKNGRPTKGAAQQIPALASESARTLRGGAAGAAAAAPAPGGAGAARQARLRDGGQAAAGREGRPLDHGGLLAEGAGGAPGERAARGRGAQGAGRARRPPADELHDVVPPSCEVLVDDGAPVEPLLGVRPWLSARAFDKMSRRTLGPSFISVASLAEEGEFTAEEPVWGLLFQLEDERGNFVDRVTLPAPKGRRKARQRALQ